MTVVATEGAWVPEGGLVQRESRMVEGALALPGPLESYLDHLMLDAAYFAEWGSVGGPCTVWPTRSGR